MINALTVCVLHDIREYGAKYTRHELRLAFDLGSRTFGGEEEEEEEEDEDALLPRQMREGSRRQSRRCSGREGPFKSSRA